MYCTGLCDKLDINSDHEGPTPGKQSLNWNCVKHVQKILLRMATHYYCGNLIEMKHSMAYYWIPVHCLSQYCSLQNSGQLTRVNKYWATADYLVNRQLLIAASSFEYQLFRVSAKRWNTKMTPSPVGTMSRHQIIASDCCHSCKCVYLLMAIASVVSLTNWNNLSDC